MLIFTPPWMMPILTETRRITSAAPAPSDSSAAWRTSGLSSVARTVAGSSGAIFSIASRSAISAAATLLALPPVWG